MKKFLLLFALLFSISLGLQGQAVVPMDSLQIPVDLVNCNDTSIFFGDTVTVYGVAVMDGGLAQVSSGRNIWIQSGAGPWSGLDVFGNSGTVIAPTDILDINAGDSVAITGYMDEYFGESEIVPISAIKLGTNKTVHLNTVDVCDLNDGQQNNNLADGEQWEGTFVEVKDVTVISVGFFSGGNRVSFTVQDQNGCVVNISDRFLVQRLPANAGTFVPPTVGDFFCSIKGVLTHSLNNCNTATGRGYEINPFDSTHYEICSAAPSIFGVTRSPVCPGSTDSISFSCDILDSDGVTGAQLYYATGANCTSAYTSIAMTNTSGSIYQASIPPQSDGTFIKYYISATDTANNVGENPTVTNGSDPRFFKVNDNGCTISDIQFVPSCFNSDASGYRGLTVTVDGVVTASAEPNNLATVFIQEENKIDWAGIMATGSTTLANLKVGDKVEVTGDVEESFFLTRLENISTINPLGTGTINPVVFKPQDLTTYDFATNEQFESMLVSLADLNGGPLIVVQQSADLTFNFAEYRVGHDEFDPVNGTRVQAGRQTTSSIASNNVSYINDSIWIIDGGALLVDPCIVHEGTKFDTISGILYYSFGNYKVLPRNNDDYVGGFADSCPGAVAVIPPLADSRLVVYPNPAQDQLNLDYDFNRTVSGIIEMRDLMGRLVKTEILNGVAGTLNLDTNNLNAGTYVLSFRENNGQWNWNAKVILVK